MQVDGLEHFESWCAAMKRLAQARNVACKMSGLGMGIGNGHLRVSDPMYWQRSRCLGSIAVCLPAIFPSIKLFSTYDAIFDALKSITANFSHDERGE